MIKVYAHKALLKDVIDNSYFGERTDAYRNSGIKYVVFPNCFHFNCYYSRKEMLQRYSLSALKKCCDVYYY